MGLRGIIIVIIVWIGWQLFNFYLFPPFISWPFWLGLCLILLMITCIQLYKLIRERNSLRPVGILKVIAFSILCYLSVAAWVTHNLIERVDWAIFYNKRSRIIEQVKSGELIPNVEYNSQLCQLPFQFPILSNGGNEIVIERSEDGKTVTVTFWTLRGLVVTESIGFVYSDNPGDLMQLQEKVKMNPDINWKIEDHWYRIVTD